MVSSTDGRIGWPCYVSHLCACQERLRGFQQCDSMAKMISLRKAVRRCSCCPTPKQAPLERIKGSKFWLKSMYTSVKGTKTPADGDIGVSSPSLSNNHYTRTAPRTPATYRLDIRPMVKVAIMTTASVAIAPGSRSSLGTPAMTCSGWAFLARCRRPRRGE